MTRIVFNMNSLQNSIIPSLNSTIDSLNVLINKSADIYIPTSFKYCTKLKEIFSDNIATKNSITSVRDCIYKINTNFNNILTDMENEARNISNIDIGKRVSPIK